MDVDNREERLKNRFERIKELEDEIIRRENIVKEKERARKQLLLRLSPALWADIAQWAEEEYRSINSQIEFALNEAVKNRKKRN